MKNKARGRRGPQCDAIRRWRARRGRWGCHVGHVDRVNSASFAHCPPNGDGRLAIVRRIWDKGVCAHRPRTSGTCGGRARGGIDDSSLARTVRPRACVFCLSRRTAAARVPVRLLRPRRCSESLVGRFRVCGRVRSGSSATYRHATRRRAIFRVLEMRRARTSDARGGREMVNVFRGLGRARLGL